MPTDCHQTLTDQCMSSSVDCTVPFKLPYAPVKHFLCIFGQSCTIKFTSYFISWCVFILGQECFSENKINGSELLWENDASENTLCSVSRKMLFGWKHLQPFVPVLTGQNLTSQVSCAVNVWQCSTHAWVSVHVCIYKYKLTYNGL